jgi:hypothetical protein
MDAFFNLSLSRRTPFALRNLALASGAQEKSISIISDLTYFYQVRSLNEPFAK